MDSILCHSNLHPLPFGCAAPPALTPDQATWLGRWSTVLVFSGLGFSIEYAASREALQSQGNPLGRKNQLVGHPAGQWDVTHAQSRKGRGRRGCPLFCASPTTMNTAWDSLREDEKHVGQSQSHSSQPQPGQPASAAKRRTVKALWIAQRYITRGSKPQRHLNMQIYAE